MKRAMVFTKVKSLPLIFALLLIGLLILSGIYNTYLVGFHLDSTEFNSSELNMKVSFSETSPQVVKDITRVVAALEKTVVKKEVIYDSVSLNRAVEEKAQEQMDQESLIQEDLDLVLVEAFNPKIHSKVMTEHISGSIAVGGGEIEQLAVNFPNGDSIDLSYLKIRGNLFVYEDETGAQSSGVIYKVDNSYMVTFSSGSFNGTRLKFGGASSSSAESYYDAYDYREEQERYPANEKTEQESYKEYGYDSNGADQSYNEWDGYK